MSFKKTALLATISVIFIGLVIKAYKLYQTILPIPLTFWQQSNANNTENINHSLWQQFLNNNVLIDKSDKRTVNYAQVNQRDKQLLIDYLAQMQSIDPRKYHKNEQFAYWVNLYNALTIHIVLKHYPIESIKDIGDGYTGPWNFPVATIAEQPVTLNNIEHGILRSLWQEPRVHYVINCASIGCPDLPLQALTADNTEEQLNIGAKRFIAQSKGIEIRNNELVLSSIYNWFIADFGGDIDEVLNHISLFAEPALAEKIKSRSQNVKFDYNWKLNAPDAGLIK